jgi:GH24 family phage-related lysozyme (muramidase)
MNDYAAQLLREFEGYRDSPYWDVNAYRAGYGSDTTTLADGRVVPIRQGMTVTREDSERDLSRRVAQEFTPRITSAIGAETFTNLTPQQQAALVSITYNYGSLPGSVVSAIRGGDPGAVAAAIRGLGGHNEGVNRDRRNREAEIYGGAGIASNALAGMPGQPLAPDQNALTRPAPFQMIDARQDPAAFMSRRRFGDNALGGMA